MPKKTTTSNKAATGKTNTTSSASTAKRASGTRQKSTGSASSASGGKQANLRKIFEKELNDIYSAETQLLKALPEMARAADSEDLQDAFEQHTRETQKQVERLEKIFERLGIEKENETCEAMQGLIQENKEIISEFDRSPARDSALIIGAQKVEHYEIASYGSLCELADVLGMHKVCDILDRTLEEEERTDHILTDIARDVNDEAAEMGWDEDEEEEGDEETYASAGSNEDEM